MIKYFLYIGEAVLGLKFDRVNNVVSIGGYNQFEPIAAMIVESYFNINLVEDSKGIVSRSQVQKNKFRYDFKCTFKEFLKAVENLKENHTLEETKTLLRVMR